MHIKVLEKQKQANPEISRREEILKIWDEINKIETTGTIQRNNETKSWFLERISKIDKPLAKLAKIKKEKTQISKLETKKLKTDTSNIQSILGNVLETSV
jgi:hypothetical protein